MFCQKCGSQINEGAEFCQKCGAKIVSASVVEAENKKNTGKSAKRKFSKWILTVGLVIVAIVAIIAAFWEGGIDYEATVEAHKPFAVSQGLPYTYGEVFGRYISSPKWKTRESGDGAYVDINGILKGTDMEVIITISVMPNPQDTSGILISPDTIVLDGVESPVPEDAVQFLYAMFAAYDEGYVNLARLLSQEAAGAPSDDSGTGTNSAGKKIYYIGDTVQISWEDGSSASISFLDWGFYYDYKNDKRLYIEYEVTNTGTDEFTVGSWFSIYADNYAVESYMEGEWVKLQPNRSAQGKIRGEINPDSASVIEVEFADAVLVVKDGAQDSDMWGCEEGAPSAYLSGYYVGDMFYEMSISIYSSPERLMIGNVTIYQDGAVIDIGELFQEGENTYGIEFGGALAEQIWYIFPYYQDGILYIDLTDENGDYVDMFYMQEQYVS